MLRSVCILSFRLINRICLTEKDAKNIVEKLKGSVRNPSVEYSKNSNSWVVVLCKADDRATADSAYQYFRGKGIDVAIQRVVE